MIDPRRVLIRSLLRGVESDAPRGGGRHPGGIASLLVVLLVVVLVGWRWYDAAVAQPVHMGEIPAPHLLVLVQEGDCPDRRAGLDRWLALMRSSGVDAGLPLAVVALDGQPPTGAPGDLPPLEPDQVPGVTRALLRFGVATSPALLLVDERGYPTFAMAIDPGTPDDPTRLAHRTLHALIGISSTDGGMLEWNR
jgi:hypothetical protein